MPTNIIGVASENSAHTSKTWSIVAAAIEALKNFNSEVKRSRRIRADREVLMSMPEHMLHDIGIRRSEIDYVVRHGREIDRIREKAI
jgi:uncharacterized protein YjiS (DUF1127 family)